MADKHLSSDILQTRLNQETSRIAWSELQRFFAAGTVVAVAPELDLVDVAAQFSADNRNQVEQWLIAGHIGKVSDQQAKDWLVSDAEVWAVVVRPWVLVQPCARIKKI